MSEETPEYPITIPDPADRYNLEVRVVRIARDDNPEKVMAIYSQTNMKYSSLVLVEKAMIDGFFVKLNEAGQAVAKQMDAGA